jgi:hypothetical protein
VQQGIATQSEEASGGGQRPEGSGYTGRMEAARVQRRGTQGITETASGINADHNGGKHIAAGAVHSLSHGKGRRTDNGNRVHDGAGVVAFNIAVVAERSVHQRGGHAVGAQRASEDLAFGLATRLAHETLQYRANVILRRGCR